MKNLMRKRILNQGLSRPSSHRSSRKLTESCLIYVSSFVVTQVFLFWKCSKNKNRLRLANFVVRKIDVFFINPICDWVVDKPRDFNYLVNILLHSYMIFRSVEGTNRKEKESSSTENKEAVTRERNSTSSSKLTEQIGNETSGNDLSGLFKVNGGSSSADSPVQKKTKRRKKSSSIVSDDEIEQCKPVMTKQNVMVR